MTHYYRNKLKLFCVFLLTIMLSPVFAQMPNVALLADIRAGATGASPTNMIKFGSIVIFSANDGNGTELWKTDGTAAGTVLVKDINVSTATASSSPNQLTEFNGFIYFTANDGVNGGALWRTDGTTAGTTMVKDISPLTSSASTILNLYNSNNTLLYFRANDGVNGVEIWTSNGTTAGTTMLKDVWVGGDGGSPLFATGEFVYFNGLTYFSANTGANGGQDDELWRSNGTTAGTAKFVDLYSFGSGGCSSLFNAGTFLFFIADNQSNTGFELWKTDGTNTTFVKDILAFANVGSNFANVSVPRALMGGYVYFTAYDTYDASVVTGNNELWRTDGTTAGTTRVKDINPGLANSDPSNFYVYNNKLYFTANDGTNGTEVWVSDGTSGGTVMLKDINVGGNASASGFTAHNGWLYFTANNGSTVNGSELWRTDGTLANTQIVEDINVGTSSSSPGSFVSLDATHMLLRASGGTLMGSELFMLGGQSVTLTTSANGTVSPPGSISTSNTIEIAVKNGSNATFNFTPSPTFSVNNVLVNGGSVGGPSSYTFNAIGSNQTLNVTFGSAPVCTPPSFTSCPGTQNANAAIGSCSATVSYSAAATGSPSPSLSYSFSGATSGSGSGIGSGSTFNVGSTTVTLTANNGCNPNATCTFTVIVNNTTTWYLDADNDNYYTGSGVTQCNSPGAGYRNSGLLGGSDCNDNNAAIHSPQTYYVDNDGDGFGSSTTGSFCQLTAPSGYSANNFDCNDGNSGQNPNTVWYLDADNDNYYTGSGITQCTSPGAGYKFNGLLGGSDCNDNNAAIHSPQTYYVDGDGDGFGSSTTGSFCQLTPPSGYASNNTDCNDGNGSINPNTVWYLDADNDNYYTGSGITQCTSPGAGYKFSGLLGGSDCDDNNAAIHTPQTYYVDGDGDGFGSTTTGSFCQLTAPSGYSANNFDCNDGNAAQNPNTVWYLDADNDNYYTGSGVTQCTSPGAGYKFSGLLGGSDCDDNNGAVHVGQTYYADSDNDGFGVSTPTIFCQLTAPSGYTTNNTDCNDGDVAINPNTIWYLDADNDNYYTGTGTTQCSSPGVGYKYSGLLGGNDCDDNNAAIHAPQTYYVDGDGDGFGSTTTGSFCQLTAPSGYSANNTDCNDGDAAINPNTVWYLDADNDNYYTGSGATQCTSPGAGYKYNGLLGGNDCDDNNNAIQVAVTYYVDGDGDGFGSSTTASFCQLTAPSGYSTNNLDCNDGDAAVNPNTIWYLDADNDNYYTGSGTTQCTSPGAGYKFSGLLGGNDCNDNNSAIKPGATEICGNGVDDNCDGQTDEGCPAQVLTWTGTVSTNWHTAGNWTPALVPNASDSVKINGATPFAPAISSNAAVNGIRFIGANVTLTINSGAELTVNGQWVANNTKVIGAGFLKIAGASKKMSGISVINKLKVANNTSINTGGKVTIVDVIDVQSGTFATTNLLVLRSDSFGTARVAPLLTGDITGNVTQERYVGPGPVAYQYLGIGVSGQTINSIKDDILVYVGPGGTAFWYNETLPGNATGSGWTNYPANSSALPPHRGLCAQMYSRPIVIDYTGPLYKGTQNIPITYTNTGFPTDDGNNFVSNPYTSPIDWDAPTGWTRTNLSPDVYVYDFANNNQMSYNHITNIGTGGFDGKIASGQAFTVKATAAGPVLSVNENIKTTSATYYKTDETISSYLRIKVRGENGNGDEMILGFATQGTEGYDTDVDAPKVGLGFVDMSMVAPKGEKLTQQFVNADADNMVIPVSFNTNGEIGKFHINFSNMQMVNKTVYLRDNLTGKVIDVATQPDFVFDVTTQNMTANDTRFDLLIGSGSETSVESLGMVVYPNPATSSFTVAVKGMKAEGVITVYDLVGKVVLQQSEVANSRYVLSTDNLESGIYMVEVNDGFSKQLQKLNVSK
jgi:ELWxxDGT repeat protein